MSMITPPKSLPTSLQTLVQFPNEQHSPIFLLSLRHHRQPIKRLAAGDFSTPPTEFGSGEARKGCQVLAEALAREGVSDVFTCTGGGDGASTEIRQAIARSQSLRTVDVDVLPRDTGTVGVCIADLSAQRLWCDLILARNDRTPLVTIVGFQEAFVEKARSYCKYSYLVRDAQDIPRVVKEAFLLARFGRPGPVLIAVPNDIQHQMVVPEFDNPAVLEEISKFAGAFGIPAARVKHMVELRDAIQTILGILLKQFATLLLDKLATFLSQRYGINPDTTNHCLLFLIHRALAFLSDSTPRPN